MDELQLEAAYRHAETELWGMWHGLQPDEEAMAREDGETEIEARAAAMEALLCYFFAGGAQQWLGVAARVVAAMRRLCPALLAVRGGCGFTLNMEVKDYERRCGGGFRMDELEGLVSVAAPGVVERIMGWMFPPVGKSWLEDGCKRLYLIARAYQPDLVRMGGKDASYEDFAVVFGEIRGVKDCESARARSRWSARARLVLREPIERTGGKVGSLFGKSVKVREKYRQAAKGNGNRRKVARDGGKSFGG